MIFQTLLLLGLFFMKTTADTAEKVTIQESLRHFLGTVERYKNGMNDVVFLLDESGSIGADKFIEVKKFTELMARQFSVSADETRVAVVTFADDNKEHVNYIADHKGNNMCTLLQKIEDIPYRTGGTRTKLAMEEAERILDRARPNARKIIVLLTDGQSNDGYSPIAISVRLKNKGFIIFAIGVAGVNQEEIDKVASNKNHTYILTEFKHIVDVNNYLIGDVIDTFLDLSDDDSLCKAACDVNAKCYCGSSSGKYECKCNAGYEGHNGFIGQCQKCPRGTYKPKAENIKCVQCPEHSTTFKEGSTDLTDCKCDSGYERIGEICSPLKCAALSAPEGGILIPRYCNNTYGTMCQFKCNKGYCPISCKDNPPHPFDNDIILPKRTCLETRKWSNDEFYCEKMSCPALSIPQNGMHNCSDKDFTYGTTCAFKCDEGYELSGSAYRTCDFKGWTGKDVQCEEIHCGKLHTNDVLKVKPVECGTGSSPYRSVCTYFCAKGYVLLDKGNRTDGILKCKANKQWSGLSKRIGCRDIEPPKITCPASIKVNTIPDKDHAIVSWDWPNATDNLHVADIRILKPDWLQQKKVPAAFPINETKVVYEAIDIEKNTKTCSFSVTVLDKEPPKALKCPKDIEVYHDENKAIPVTWEGPIFEDNSKENLSIIRNRESGNLFGWGPPNIVTITASDESNNTASCSFSVKVKPYPCPYYDPPANGAVTCDNWQSGRVCSIFCHDGFDFATSRKDVSGLLLCNPDSGSGKKVGKWQNFKTQEILLHEPWPDCSRKQKPDNVDAWIGMGFTVDTCTDEMIQKMREKFFDSIKKVPFLCKKKKGCAPKNVNVTCSPITTRRKRSSSYVSRISYGDTANKFTKKYNRLPRQTSKQMLTVSFNVEMLLKETDQSIDEKTSNAPNNEDKIDLSSNPTIKELKDTISLDVKDIYNLKTVPKPDLDIGIVAICSTGQVNVNNSCVNCPAGTYKDDVSENCISCRTATYQDEERQMSCKACPVGYTTYQVKSKSIDDCKAPCQPGTYSETAFEPCFACPLNTYQARSSGRECKKCPSGLYTWKVGASSSNDCVAPCKAGSFSDTGYKPCTLCDINSYQDKEMQKECMLCPNRTGTTHEGSKTIEDCKEIDVCNSLRPCKHDSTCNQLDKEYECVCPVGLRGKHCEINPDDCDPNPCLNNGTCVDGIGNFTCICPKGLGGHQCEINYDDCLPNPCLNGAQCIDKINAHECHCAAGFYGEKCEKNIYECHPNPCLNNGTCFDMVNDYRCCCSKDYTGKNCELQVNTTTCDTVTCENGGTCVVDNESFNCICPHGFEGDVCEINVDDCTGIQCENGGTCIDGIGNATCKCLSKFVGLRCEEALIPEFLLNFPAPDTANYAKAVNNHSLHEITVALFMRTSLADSNSRSTPLSYSYIHDNNLQDNALTLYDTNNLILYIHGEQFFTEFTTNSDALWHHYAITWEKINGKWLFYVDGNVIMSGTAGKDKYMYPGIFILGQEQDGFGDRFNSLEAFAGDITEFNVWDYVLTTEEIKRISSGCGYVGNVIPWYILSQSVFGNVAVSQDVDKCKALGSCPKNSCDCFYADSTEGYSCKYIVQDCIDENTCSYGQPCESTGNFSYCNCRDGFEGRRCEYDIDECLENNGGCKYICVNDVGTGSYHCECPDDMVLSEDGKLCKDTNYCVKDDKIYMDGEDWVSSCQNCSCDHGSFTCKDIVCDVAACLPEETLVSSPGECCPKCVAWSFCLISPNNTILTFDLSSYEIDGICTYTALEDCIGGRFKIQIESSEVAPGQETNVIFYQDCYKVIISSNGMVTVDNTMVNSTFQNEALTVEYFNSSFSLKTSSDILVQWNFVDEIMISVPITDMHKMCGVCSKIEEYYLPGKFPLTERFALGENECFLVPEDYEEIKNESSGTLNICLTNNMFTMLLLTITLFLFSRNRNFM